MFNKKNIKEANKVQYGIIKKFLSHSTNYLIDLVQARLHLSSDHSVNKIS